MEEMDPDFWHLWPEHSVPDLPRALWLASQAIAHLGIFARRATAPDEAGIDALESFADWLPIVIGCSRPVETLKERLATLPDQSLAQIEDDIANALKMLALLQNALPE